MKVAEFLIEQHRITFDDDCVEIEEFNQIDTLISRIFINHKDFKKLIMFYQKWLKDNND